MSTRRIFLGLLITAIASVGVWFWPAGRKFATDAITLVQTNGLYVIAATIIVIGILAFIIHRSNISARTRKRELDEYLRVAQQTSSSTPQSVKREVSDAIAKETVVASEKAPSAQQNSPKSSVIASGTPKPTRPAEPELAAISDDLFFQPVTKMPDGQIVGYEIYRQATPTSRQEPIFIQSNPTVSTDQQAEFEFSTLEKVAAAANQEMWADLAVENQIRFFVQISDALLDDKSLWRSAVSLLKKQSKSNPTIALGMRSSAFADFPQKTIKERLQKLNRLHNAGVLLALYGLQHDHELVANDLLDCFYLVICDKDELLSCYADEAAPAISASYQQAKYLLLDVSVQGIASEADVIDCIAAGAKFMSGDYLAPPRKLKSEASVGSDAAE